VRVRGLRKGLEHSIWWFGRGKVSTKSRMGGLLNTILS